MTRKVHASWSLMLIIAAFSMGATTAKADEVEAPSSEQGVIRNVLGSIGIIEPQRPDIDYRERGPLVIPPSVDALPPPVDPETRRNKANWPQDAKTKARKEASREKGRPVNEKFDYMDGDPKLSVHQMLRERAPSDRSQATAKDLEWISSNRAVMSPDELRKHRSTPSTLPPGGEPERRYLSDPPAGYRKPAATASNVTEVTDPKPSFWQRINPF